MLTADEKWDWEGGGVLLDASVRKIFDEMNGANT